MTNTFAVINAAHTFNGKVCVMSTHRTIEAAEKQRAIQAANFAKEGHRWNCNAYDGQIVRLAKTTKGSNWTAPENCIPV